jgi:hypothetical protein
MRPICCAGPDGKVRNETVANLSHLPGELTSRSLKGEAFVPAGQAVTVSRTGTSRRSGRRPGRWACPPCWPGRS